MAERSSDDDQIEHLFPETDSSGDEEFEGFDARDTRRYAEIADEVPLFCSTPKPKRFRPGDDKRRLEYSSSDGIQNEPDIGPRLSHVNSFGWETEMSPRSSSSIEGEIFPNIYSYKPPVASATPSLMSVI